MSAPQSWLQWFKSTGRPSSGRRTPSPARLGSRLCRLEPLEQRMVLSVISPMMGPFETVATADVAAAHAEASLSEPVRISVWTPERIEDVGAWVEMQAWPESMYVDRELVTELVHIPVRSEARGGYNTILRISPITELSPDEAVAALASLDFVEFARLESKSVIQYGPRSQELIDATKMDAGPGEAQLFGEPVGATQESLHEAVRIGVWTPERIADVGIWAASQAWPRGIAVDAECVKELLHMPLWSDPRGGFRTILDVNPITELSADEAIAALVETDFVDFARLESKSSIHLSPRTQELIDAITTGAAPGQGGLFGEEEMPRTNFRVTFWTENRIANVDSFVDTTNWPDALGTVTADTVEQLVSIPVYTEARGGYFTVVRMEVSGDITAIEEVDSVESVILEAESSVHLDSHVQELIDAITTGPAEGYGELFLSESRDLIQADSYHADPRFSDFDGSGYAIAVLDTGIDKGAGYGIHDFFGDRVVYEQDFADGDMDAEDTFGHGTHVTSIAAGYDAVGDLSGIAPGADIVALKVFQDGSPNFYWTDLQAALQCVVTNAVAYNIAAVNMSLGSGNYQSAQSDHDIGDELATLAGMRVIVVSASGNSFHGYNDTQGVAYPAADPNSLAVGAVYDADLGRRPPVGYVYGDYSYANTTDVDRIAPYSQRHATLTTIMAPGEMITGAWLDNGTNSIYGTSMAAPHVAGMAVLAQQLAVQEWGRSLTQDEFIDLLQDTGTSVNDGDDENDNVTNA